MFRSFRSIRSFTRSFWCKLIIIMMVSCLHVTVVAAAQPTKAEMKEGHDLADKGRQNFKAKNYAKAAEYFKKSFKLTREPAVLFNLARCHQEINTLKSLEAASGYFNQFIDISKKSDAKKDAKMHLKKIDDEIDRLREKEDDRLAAEISRQREKKRMDKALRTAHPKTTVTVTKPFDTTGRDNLITYGIAGAGLALGITNIVGISYLRSEKADLNNMDFGVDDAQSIYTTRAEELNAQRTYFIVAGIAGIGLASWAVFRWFNKPAKSKLTLSPIFSPFYSGFALTTHL